MVSDSVPIVRVAVILTVVCSAANVTTPSLVITSRLSLSQAITEPFVPVNGKPMSPAPRTFNSMDNAAWSSATFCASVNTDSAMVIDCVGNNCGLLYQPMETLVKSTVTPFPVPFKKVLAASGIVETLLSHLKPIVLLPAVVSVNDTLP